MNQVQVYRILTAHGFNKADAEGLIDALKDDDRATKQDLQLLKLELNKDMKDMEIRLLGAINGQTWKFIGSLAVLGVIFKIAEMIIK